MSILNDLQNKDYLKRINNYNSQDITDEIRKIIVNVVTENGGHLASNLGVVELTLALYKVFDFPRDKIIFDVGHQCYVHKLLSGRTELFSGIRKLNGLSGFPKYEESEYDVFNTGHSSTSISAALGMARARDLLGETYNIIALIGDGAIGGGMALEAINDLGSSNCKLIIILNDNEMSINKNVGGLSKYFNKLRLSKKYKNVKIRTHKMLDKIGSVGESLTNFLKKIKEPIKYATVKVPVFEELGLTYIGLIDGHNIDELTTAFNKAKMIDGPVIVHTITKKGKGYQKAELNPEQYHSVTSKSCFNDLKRKTYTNIFSECICKMANNDEKLVAITAAMSSGCGLDEFRKLYNERFFDVGIAEQHAVTMAGGMAKNGLLPIFVVYSTFLQRGYDQIIHDICMQRLHVVFCIDRAGIVGEDGETHHGVFDLSYLTHIPNLTILAPSCQSDMENMMHHAVYGVNGPVAIRYPKGDALERENALFSIDKPELVSYTGDDIIIFSIGKMLKIAEQATHILKKEGYNKVSLYNIGTVKPLNTELYNKILNKCKLAVTIEDNILNGGAGQYISLNVDRKHKSKILNIGFDDVFITHGAPDEIFAMQGFTPELITKKIIKEMIVNE